MKHTFTPYNSFIPVSFHRKFQIHLKPEFMRQRYHYFQICVKMKRWNINLMNQATPWPKRLLVNVLMPISCNFHSQWERNSTCYDQQSLALTTWRTLRKNHLHFRAYQPKFEQKTVLFPFCSNLHSELETVSIINERTFAAWLDSKLILIPLLQELTKINL